MADNFGPEDPGSGLGMAGAFNADAGNYGPEDPGSGLGMAGVFAPDAGNYGPSPNAGMPTEEQNAQYGQGRQAAETLQGFGTNPYSSGYSATAGQLNTVEPSFFESLMAVLKSPGGRAIRGVASAFNPAFALANLVFGVSTSKDPLGAALGAIPGWGGLLASTAYGAMNSKDPMGYLGNRALTTGAGMIGARTGIPGGGGLASQAMQYALSSGQRGGVPQQGGEGVSADSGQRGPSDWNGGNANGALAIRPLQMLGTNTPGFSLYNEGRG